MRSLIGTSVMSNAPSMPPNAGLRLRPAAAAGGSMMLTKPEPTSTLEMSTLMPLGRIVGTPGGSTGILTLNLSMLHDAEVDLQPEVELDGQRVHLGDARPEDLQHVVDRGSAG